MADLRTHKQSPPPSTLFRLYRVEGGGLLTYSKYARYSFRMRLLPEYVVIK